MNECYVPISVNHHSPHLGIGGDLYNLYIKGTPQGQNFLQSPTAFDNKICIYCFKILCTNGEYNSSKKMYKLCLGGDDIDRCLILHIVYCSDKPPLKLSWDSACSNYIESVTLQGN